MSFNLNTLVPEETTEDKPFDVNTLVGSNSPEQKAIEAEEAANAPNMWSTGLNAAGRTLVDFLIPDDILRIISTNDPKPWQGTRLGHSIANPQKYMEDQKMISENIMGTKMLPISDLPTSHERAMASAIGQLGDPTSWSAKGLWGGLKAGVQTLLPSYFGSMGGEVAQDAVANAGGGDTAQMVAGLAGGITAGVTMGVAQVPINFGAQKAGQAVTSITKNIANRDQVVENVAEWGTKAITKDILTSQPNLPKIVAQSQRMAARLGYPDMAIASIAPLVANNQINRDFQTFYNSNTNGFKTKVDDAVTEYNRVLKDYTEQFGGKQDVQAKRMINAIENEKSIIVKRQEAKEAILIDKQNSITDEIAEKSQDLYEAGDSVESGRQIENLQRVQRELAQKQMSADYDAVLNNAENKGVKIDAAGTQAIYETNVASRIQEEFGKGNRLSTLIDQKFAPVETNTGRFHPPTTPEEIKNPRPIMEQVYRDVDITAIDSFKREINLLMRGNLSPSQLTTLRDVKRGFEGQLAQADPEFAALYKATDLKYLENIGLPYNMEGVRAISRSKFSQDTAKKIMKPEVAQQFLSIAGDEGPDVLRHSLLIGLNKVIFKDGILQPKALTRWLDKPDNKLLIGMVDGLEDDLVNKGAYVTSLQDNLATVGLERSANSRHQTDSLFSALGKNTRSVTDEILTNTNKRNEWFDTINKMTPDNKAIVMDGLRQDMTRKAMAFARDNDKTIMEHLKDPQYRPAYIKMFGAKHFRGLQALSIIGDSQAELRLDRLQMGRSTKEREYGKQEFGFGASNITALWRRQMISAAQKVTILASMLGTKKLQNANDNSLIELMLSKDFASQVGDSVEFVDGKAFVKANKNEFLMSIMELSGRGGYAGGNTGTTPPEQSPQER